MKFIESLYRVGVISTFAMGIALGLLLGELLMFFALKVLNLGFTWVEKKIGLYHKPKEQVILEALVSRLRAHLEDWDEQISNLHKLEDNKKFDLDRWSTNYTTRAAGLDQAHSQLLATLKWLSLDKDDLDEKETLKEFYNKRKNRQND